MDPHALTLELLSWPSVTGTDGERAFGPRLRDRLAALPGVEVWLEDAGQGRSTVCALARGAGDACVVLAGHYDVVDDTGMRPAHLVEPDWLAGCGALDLDWRLGINADVVTDYADGGDFPWINAGPWGRDFHRPGERVHVPYAFGVVPDLIAGLAAAALGC